MAQHPDLSEAQHELVMRARGLARDELLPRAAQVDRSGSWPAESLRAIGRAGLLGLHIPQEPGGLDEGLHTLALVTEELAAACGSTAMCYGMHCVASRVIATQVTGIQQERYLSAITRGEHVTSLALSEPGTGAHFYIPRSTFTADADHFVLHGSKSFITSGGQADSFVVSAVAADATADPGTFSCFILDAGVQGLVWGDAWDGIGMRGNSSRSARLDKVRVPKANLLGNTGDQIWYVFEVITPCFIVAMSGVYLGIARAAFELARDHLAERRHEHTGKTLTDHPTLLARLARIWSSIERTRALVHQAARLADAGSPDAFDHLAAAKIEVADMVVAVTTEALGLSGGKAYEANGTLARLLRDAHAAPVMSPTTRILEQWLGRRLAGLPMF